jgi:Protein of unknown function (DUF2934)
VAESADAEDRRPETLVTQNDFLRKRFVSREGTTMKHTANNSSVHSSFNSSEALDRHEIRTRAYELYLQRGSEDGHDVEDWLRAEIEMAGQRASPRVMESLAA